MSETQFCALGEQYDRTMAQSHFSSVPPPFGPWPMQLSHKGVVVFPNPMKWLSCKEHVTLSAAATESSLCPFNMPFTAVTNR